MQLELKAMHKKLGITFIYVTHDQEEALTMSDTIVVMADGYIQQIGTPEMIYKSRRIPSWRTLSGKATFFRASWTEIISFVSAERPLRAR